MLHFTLLSMERKLDIFLYVLNKYKRTFHICLLKLSCLYQECAVIYLSGHRGVGGGG